MAAAEARHGETRVAGVATIAYQTGSGVTWRQHRISIVAAAAALAKTSTA